MYCDLCILSERMSAGFAPMIDAEASAIVSGLVVAEPMQKQTPATKPTAIDAMFNAVGRSVTRPNV